MENKSENAFRQIRASFTDKTIRVYQAYNDEIANNALKAQKFVPPFQTGRMTWIKPSFLWMMYRSGYGYKDKNQARILAIDITLKGFEWALENSILSTHSNDLSQKEYEQKKNQTPVRIQWDPERDLSTRPLDFRSIQIGLKGTASEKYVNEWTVKITDMTELAHEIYALIKEGKEKEAEKLLPEEKVYEVSADLQKHLQMEVGK
jgi:hypothetical protein